MDIENLLNYDYKSLIMYLNNVNVKDLSTLLQNNKLKEKIINSKDVFDFNFLVQEKNKILSYIFDNEGIKILENSQSLPNRLNLILSSKNELLLYIFENDNFLKLVIKNFDKIHTYLKISNTFANKLFNNLGNLKYDFLKNISQDNQIYIINHNNINQNEFIKTLKSLGNDIGQMLIDKVNYKIDLTTLSNKELYFLTEKNYHFPYDSLNNKEMINKLINIWDVKTYRFILNNLEKNNDITNIDNKRRSIYDNILNTYDRNIKMLDNYKKLYMMITYLCENNKFNINIISSCINEIFKDKINENFIDEIYNLCKNYDKNEIFKFLQKESNIILSNIIIDYNFNDVYFNVLKDITELISFNEQTNMFPKEKITLYQNILNLDKMPYDEKIILHNKLKQIKCVEAFYDDIRNAKNKMYLMLKNEILNKDKLNKFKDEKLSKKTRVNVYYISDLPFYALVKSIPIEKNNILTKDSFSFTSDGASFSIDSDKVLCTYINPSTSYNLMFYDFIKENVVHAFITDSFSYYDRKKSTVTSRVNKLLTPSEFIDSSYNYNEIVIAQKNIKNPDFLDTIVKPQAIYCYDNYTENDIISAKILGLDIVIINTKSYKKDNKNNFFIDNFKHYELDCNYLTSLIEYEKKR